jgi:hypothetical protein
MRPKMIPTTPETASLGDQRIGPEQPETLQPCVSNEPPRIVGGCPWVGDGVFEKIASDWGEWTAETGTRWESDRIAMAEEIEAQRRANYGNRRASRPGTALVDGEVGDE